MRHLRCFTRPRYGQTAPVGHSGWGASARSRARSSQVSCSICIYPSIRSSWSCCSRWPLAPSRASSWRGSITSGSRATGSDSARRSAGIESALPAGDIAEMRSEQLFDVRDRIAVVTGAASGLGLAMAEAMAENGAVVAMLDIDPVGLAGAVTRLAKAGHRVEPIVLDVGETAALRAAINAVAAKHGQLDVVFANVGISAGRSFEFPEGEINAVEMARWQLVLQVNLTSVFVTLQAAAERMKAQRSGRIIVTSSIAGIRAERMVGYAYAATKAAVNNLVRQAALELAPGPFFTNIASGRLHREPEFVAKFAEMVPLKRIAQPDELKGLALLLASP